MFPFGWMTTALTTWLGVGLKDGSTDPSALTRTRFWSPDTPLKLVKRPPTITCPLGCCAEQRTSPFDAAEKEKRTCPFGSSQTHELDGVWVEAPLGRIAT